MSNIDNNYNIISCEGCRKWVSDDGKQHDIQNDIQFYDAMHSPNGKDGYWCKSCVNKKRKRYEHNWMRRSQIRK